MRRIALTTAIVVATSVTGVASTASAADTPGPQTMTGTLQTLIREQPRGRHILGSDATKVLRVGRKSVPLAPGSLATMQDGATVSVTVVPVADGTQRVLSARTISAAPTPSPEVAAALQPPRQVYLALVHPKGLDLPSVTAASATAMVDNAVSLYWASQTGGTVSFKTAQVLPYASAYGCGETSKMWNEAEENMPDAYGARKHLILVAPAGAQDFGCDYGMASIGSLSATGSHVFVSGLAQSTLAHELGHNLGLYHSNSLRCNGAQDMPVVNKKFPGCQTNEYDDVFDVMGSSGTVYGMGNLNAVHLDGMKVLPSAVRKITATSVATTARITPLSDPLSTTTASRTLKVTDPNGVSYFVEYRTKTGRDAVAVGTGYKLLWGVRVLRDDPDAPASAGSYELDATPTAYSSSDYDRSFRVGSTFTAASGKLTIQVTAADATGATVSITSPSPPPPAPPAAVTRLSDFNRDGFTDLVGRDRAGSLWLYRGNGTGGFLPRILMRTGWDDFTAIITPGDVTGDGNGDILTRNAAGQLRLYPGNGLGGFTASRLVGISGWNAMSAITGAADMTADGLADLLARDSAGRLWLYPTTTTGAFQPRRLAGVSGWNAMTAIMGAGDLNGDAKADLVARDGAGTLWLYPGNGAGGFSARTVAGASGWQVMTALVTPGNWDQASGNDVIARDSAGTLWLYPGNNAGQLTARRRIGTGFGAYTIA